MVNGMRGAVGRPRRSGRLRLVLEDELQGNCRGWDGETVFTLSSGEVWRQCAFRARSLHAACPGVRVWCCGQKYWLEVEGAGELLPVERVA